ncbi:MAG: 2-oxo acid dehydrogenase subunit E2 [Firmicutes bacterium]|nr:2-oxo acid dehydrogenase subunit E2 [Bacillota bacterium]
MAPAVRDLVMPRLGLTMRQGKITRWYKRPGEAFSRGERLMQVTTEKVAVDVEAPYDGVLLEVLVAEGGTVPVGTPVARVEAAEAPEGPAIPAAGAPGYPPAVTPAPPARPDPAAGTPDERTVRATPAARRVARELGVDLALVPGSGPEGRVTEDDVRRWAAAGEVRPHSEWRLAVARKMAAAARTVAPVTLHREVVLTRAAALLAHPEAEAAGVGPSDLVVKAVAEALREHPDLNATFTEEALIRHAEVNVGVALALPEGLLVPVVRGADALGLRELARRRRELWDRARSGRSTADDVAGGTFTVSNLGPFGVDGFTPIINLPEVAVLGVGRLARRPVVEEGRVVPRPVLPLSLTFDHRAVDGAPAAAFLDAVARRLEDPPPSWWPRRPRLTAGPDTFDLVVVGGGPAGFAAAVTAAELGARVALVEAGEVGGVCLNRGCVPTKAALELAARGGRRLEEVLGGAASVVAEVRAGAEARLADLGVTVVRGRARLEQGGSGGAGGDGSPSGTPVVRVDGRALRGAAVILATGSRPVPLEVPPVSPRAPVAVEELFAAGGELGSAGLDGVHRVLVVGGGPGGVETARLLALTGFEVTLVERLGSLLPGEEEDVGRLVREGLEALGVRVLTGTDAATLAGFDLVVVAAGRRARTEGLGLEDLTGSPGPPGLLDPRGFVRVDDRLRTPLEGVWAAGDVTGPPFWAHRATEQGRAAALDALAGLAGFETAPTPRPPAPAEVPRVVFTEPEFGAVGLRPGQAAAAGLEVVVGTAPLTASSRARAARAGEGFVRVVADARTGRLLGVEAVCPGATELAATGLVALRAGLGLADLAALALPHPTYAESLGDACREALRALRRGEGRPGGV